MGYQANAELLITKSEANVLYTKSAFLFFVVIKRINSSLPMGEGPGVRRHAEYEVSKRPIPQSKSITAKSLHGLHELPFQVPTRDHPPRHGAGCEQILRGTAAVNVPAKDQ